MGNREKLLAGAKQCLFDKGYARTTARDITAAAGTSLAAIGYHFGTIEALLNAALHESLEEWGEQVKQDLADLVPVASPQERFELIWTRVIESISVNRPLWIIQFEMLVQAQYADELREPLVASVTQGRLGLAGLFAGIDATADERKAWLVGSLYQSLLVGMVVQWLLDPDHALSGRDLADALGMLPDLTPR